MSILTKNDKAKVYVGGLSVGITEEDIRHHFKKSDTSDIRRDAAEDMAHCCFS